MITSQQIVQIIKDGIEPTEPVDTILRVLRENDGKRFDKRFLAKLQEQVPDYELRDNRNYGMTQLEYKISGKMIAKPGMEISTHSLLISYETKNVVIDADKIREKNPAYFEARDERNRQRHNLLADAKDFDALANASNAFAEAKKKLQEELESIQECPDYYAIENLVGLKE